MTYKPTQKVILQGNYYAGREQRDQQIVPAPTGNERLVPKGRFHVFDAYATFLLTDKWTLALEADYVVNRVNTNDPPSRVTGGVAYLKYQWTPKFALAGRTEYLSDRGGLFTGVTQALKEITLTADYKFAEGFLLRSEYRRDWSNRHYFLTNSLDILKKEQNTATLGMVWWFGRKKGAW
ncbi:MAG: outer membrane beta-barrel protein [Pyrinomonadaceae bacterium]